MKLPWGDCENCIISKKISSPFQYSDKTIASTETNNISPQSSWSHLEPGGQGRGMIKGASRLLVAKGHWKKNLTELSQDLYKCLLKRNTCQWWKMQNVIFLPAWKFNCPNNTTFNPVHLLSLDWFESTSSGIFRGEQ